MKSANKLVSLLGRETISPASDLNSILVQMVFISLIELTTLSNPVNGFACSILILFLFCALKLASVSDNVELDKKQKKSKK